MAMSKLHEDKRHIALSGLMYNVAVAFSSADVQRVIFGWGESAEQIDAFDFAHALTSQSGFCNEPLRSAGERLGDYIK